jgi:hypothetical protein
VAIHFDAELPVAAEGDTCKLKLEIFVSRTIFDRNSQVRFHKLMVPAGFKKVPHALVRAKPVVYQQPGAPTMRLFTT